MTARVRIEFKRIQTYLFAVPRLRAILGANALVGETLRETLPALAAQAGGLMPVYPVPLRLQGLSDGLLSVAAGVHEPWAGDDPAANWASGVLTRDGGHFQALFQSVESAGSFAALADAKLTQLLPGLMVDMRVEAWGPAQSDKDLNAGWKRQPSAEPAARRDSPMRLPRRVCELSGQGEGTEPLEVGAGRDRTTYQVSAATFSYLDEYAWRRVTLWLRKRHPGTTWSALHRRYLPGWRLLRPGWPPAARPRCWWPDAAALYSRRLARA